MKTPDTKRANYKTALDPQTIQRIKEYINYKNYEALALLYYNTIGNDQDLLIEQLKQ